MTISSWIQLLDSAYRCFGPLLPDSLPVEAAAGFCHKHGFLKCPQLSWSCRESLIKILPKPEIWMGTYRKRVRAWDCGGSKSFPLGSHEGLMSHMFTFSLWQNVGFPDAGLNTHGRWAPLSLQQGTNGRWRSVAYSTCFQLCMRVESNLTSVIVVYFPYSPQRAVESQVKCSMTKL